ncbi:GGDEF domain-containing protein [Crenalkalicoccus roseus]|uniref:GGDEF domain-containing protein n=1 Tax=Crenalkalicoccus roseus TaxID=1485588 RepID=UPI001081BF9A|nr:diguanylate cyclase [Crenalkalicoccus roseus]
MTEAESFAGFSIRTDATGHGLAVFHLAVPEWRLDTGEDGTPAMREIRESVFDEASLALRVARLEAQGLDASLSRAALAALRAAAARPGDGADLPEAALAPVLAAALGAVSDAVLVATARLIPPGPRIVYANAACAALTGHAPDALRGRELAALLGPRGAAVAERVARTGRAVERGALLPGRAGAPRRVAQRILPLRDPATGGIAHLAVLLRAPALPAAGRDGVEAAADADALTGLPGRRTLALAAEEALCRAAAREGGRDRGHGLLVLWFGGAGWPEGVGDAALLGAADRLVESLRRGDLVCRTGQAECSVFLPGLGRAEVERVALRLQRAFAAAPVETPAGPVTLLPRCGIAMAPPADHPGGAAARAAALLAAAEALRPLPERAPG